MRQDVGARQVRLSVVLSKQQAAAESQGVLRVSAWAESSVRTHTPGPTSGFGPSLKEEGPWLRTPGAHLFP
jgi:hypothetical protein